jgi:hypothetical protein
MTAQINDAFQHRNTIYSVAGISEGKVFDISVLGLKPSGTSTACYRGYQAIFAISQSRLVLESLHVNLLPEDEENQLYQQQQGPVINGVTPSPSSGGINFFNNYYEGLNFPLKYTGGLLLATGFIKNLYVHMGFHQAWKYEKVIELIFDAGILKKEFDRSDQMAEIREMVAESQNDGDSSKMQTKNEIMRFVERAFDRTYHRWST